jgi:hypothetical protein
MPNYYMELDHNPYLVRRKWLALILIFVGLAIIVSVTNPLFEASDEIRHYRYVRILATERRLPVQGQEAQRAQSHHPPLYHALAAALSAWVPTPHDGRYQHIPNPFWAYRSHVPGVDNKLQYWHSPAEPFRQGYLAALLPRWLNVALGAATVGLTYRLAQRSFGGHRRAGEPQSAPPQSEINALAFAAAAIVALNPQFIYISGAINNDIIAALMGTGILYSCVVIVQGGITLRRAALIGVVSGLGLLAKFQVGVLGLVVLLALVMATWTAQDRTAWMRRLLFSAALIGAIVLIISGWWFVRNQRLYGEPTGLQMLNAMWGGRKVTENLWAIGQGLPQLWHSMWGQFGYGQVPLPDWMMNVMLALCLLCLSGLFRVRRRTLSTKTLGLLLTSIALMFIAVAYYMASNPAGAMGRFLFPVLPAFAILLVAGLNAWLARPVTTQIAVVGAISVFCVTALFGFLWPAVTYPPRQTLPSVHPESASVARIGDVAEILAVAVDENTTRPGSTVHVRVNWRPLRWTDEPLAVFVHLIDEVGVVVAQRDTWPGLSRAPTTAWQIGSPFIDVYRIDLPTTLYAPNQLTVHIGMYGSEIGRLPISLPGVQPTDSWPIGQVRVTPLAGRWPNPLEVNFDNQLQLIGYEIAPRAVAAGETFTLTTFWQVPTPPATPQHIFAQVVDSEWRVWGSNDGGHPDWITDIATDTRQITIIPETPPGSYPVNVGLASDAGRLAILGPGGRPLGDFVPLGPVGVR